MGGKEVKNEIVKSYQKACQKYSKEFLQEFL